VVPCSWQGEQLAQGPAYPKSFSTTGALKPNSCAAALNSSRRRACVNEMTLFMVWLSR
jgi:hypothetical protein